MFKPLLVFFVIFINLPVGGFEPIERLANVSIIMINKLPHRIKRENVFQARAREILARHIYIRQKIIYPVIYKNLITFFQREDTRIRSFIRKPLILQIIMIIVRAKKSVISLHLVSNGNNIALRARLTRPHRVLIHLIPNHINKLPFLALESIQHILARCLEPRQIRQNALRNNRRPRSAINLQTRILINYVLRSHGSYFQTTPILRRLRSYER